MSYKVQKPCKVCGKMYTPCSDCERDKSAFHWRTVACSIECGTKYFQMVEEARSADNKKSKQINENNEELSADSIISNAKVKNVSSKREKITKKENIIESEKIE